MKQPESNNELSLDNCDKEPVHIPGYIQDIAVLIGLDATFTKVLYCSDNSELAFSKPANALLGTKLSDMLSTEVIHALNNALSVSTARTQREHVAEWSNGETLFDVWAHYSNQHPVLEFEPTQKEDISSYQSIKNVRSLLARLGQIEEIERALQNAVVGLRDLTGFDRVMLYQFDSNGDGEVKAEAKGIGTESFLNLRFPRWDIPKQAREILKKLPLRLIANVKAEPIPLVAADDAAPLDLTLAACRGQSPIHSEYLTNMGVEATMTLSIVIRGELWGLFAFHHFAPRYIGPAQRGAAELFVQFFSIQLEQRLEKKGSEVVTRSNSYEKELFTASESANDLTALVEQIADSLCEHIDCDGVAVVTVGDVFLHGKTPDAEQTRNIAEHLLNNTEKDNASTDHLLGEGFDVAPCAGAFALTIDASNQDRLMFFREEAALSVTWAGAPDKNIVQGEDGPRLVPRGSFEAYKQVVKDQSRKWESVDITAALQLRESLSKANFHRLNKIAERQRTVYIDELNHRIRNILALIRSLARRTKESSTSLESYAKSLEQRIAALGAAHDLAANRISSGIEIFEVFTTEIKAFTADEHKQLILTGENYVVRADIAPTFALISHELMTNCVKHGALSTSNGCISIDVKGDHDGITITWTETGGPPAVKPDHTGFGLSLITTAIPYELDGYSTLDFLPEGLKAVFWLPKKLVVAVADSEAALSPSARAKLKEIPKQVLIVEDSMMVAIDMADMLGHIGVEHVEKCGTVAQAKSTLRNFEPDFAVLDIELREERTFEIADLLEMRKIPFCFATGYGSNFATPDRLQSKVVLTKPVTMTELQKTIKELYGTSSK